MRKRTPIGFMHRASSRKSKEPRKKLDWKENVRRGRRGRQMNDKRERREERKLSRPDKKLRHDWPKRKQARRPSLRRPSHARAADGPSRRTRAVPI